ncbi:MAG: orotidine-5'-phosphate decarboxylase [Thermoplasmatota archaeon]
MRGAFAAKLAQAATRSGAWLCVGLDPEPKDFPAGLTARDAPDFCRHVVRATAPFACAFKANAAFFEALGARGHEALEAAVAAVPKGIPFILDGKRNDIGNTAAKYAAAAFDGLKVDAVTVTPYLGKDTVEPFARYEDRGVFLLARTSNPSAGDFQDINDAHGVPLYRRIAMKGMEWNREFGNLGLVAGATYLRDLADLRALCGAGVPLLIPGVGAQGADAREAVAHGADASGRFALVNVGRAILKAGSGPSWEKSVGEAARTFASQLAAPLKGPQAVP